MCSSPPALTPHCLPQATLIFSPGNRMTFLAWWEKILLCPTRCKFSGCLSLLFLRHFILFGPAWDLPFRPSRGCIFWNFSELYFGHSLAPGVDGLPPMRPLKQWSAFYSLAFGSVAVFLCIWFSDMAACPAASKCLHRNICSRWRESSQGYCCLGQFFCAPLKPPWALSSYLWCTFCD